MFKYKSMFILGLLAACQSASAQDRWPAFLGQGYAAIDSANLPVKWSPKENIAWKAKLSGKGQSSPVVWDDLAFVTSVAGSMKETCHIQAFSVKDGTIKWSQSIPASQTVRSNYFQSRSAPTPLVDAQRIVAFFETGNLVALNHQGEILWQRSLTDEFGPFESTIGLAASPAQLGDCLFLLVDHEGASYLMAINKADGVTKWKADRDSRVSYASPMVVNVAGQPQIVCSSAGTVEGFDPNTGEQLWSFEQVGGNSQNSPICFGDGMFLVGASPGMHDERESEARQSNLCMKIVRTDTGYEPQVLWRTTKAMSSFASPMTFKGYAYWVTKAGVLYCYDATTGDEVYRERLPQQCWATPFGIEDRVYFFGKDGTTAVIAAGPKFAVLAENQLWDPEEHPLANPGSRGGRSTHEHKEGETKEDTNMPKGPASRSQAGSQENGDAPKRPTQSEAEIAAARSQGENRFADPVQYGYAITNQGILIRTGEALYCVRP